MSQKTALQVQPSRRQAEAKVITDRASFLAQAPLNRLGQTVAYAFWVADLEIPKDHAKLCSHCGVHGLSDNEALQKVLQLGRAYRGPLPVMDYMEAETVKLVVLIPADIFTGLDIFQGSTPRICLACLASVQSQPQP